MHRNQPVGVENKILKALKFSAQKLGPYSTEILIYYLTALSFSVINLSAWMGGIDIVMIVCLTTCPKKHDTTFLFLLRNLTY